MYAVETVISYISHGRGRAVPLEIAAGYAVWRSGETADQLYHRADANMYAEKQKMKAAGV